MRQWYDTRVEQLPIVSPFLVMEGEPLTVNLPSKEDLLGDKLTAFAPNTTGIPYIKMTRSWDGSMEERHCGMEIIKQLFDVASLFDGVEDLRVVRETFGRIAPIELEYRGLNKDNLMAVLEDIYRTAELVCTGIYTNYYITTILASLMQHRLEKHPEELIPRPSFVFPRKPR